MKQLVTPKKSEAPVSRTCLRKSFLNKALLSEYKPEIPDSNANESSATTWRWNYQASGLIQGIDGQWIKSRSTTDNGLLAILSRVISSNAADDDAETLGLHQTNKWLHGNKRVKLSGTPFLFEIESYYSQYSTSAT